jgi:translocation protein SEC63
VFHVSRAGGAKNGYAHAPHWPGLRKPHYLALLGDSKLDKVIVPPIRIEVPSSGSEFRLTFPAPPQPNTYSFILHLVSDTFVGNDVQLPVLMKVEEVPVEEDEDDISEPDEDSLAGQMAMMKGGRVKASAVHDDESGSEYEYESSSDEETPRRGKAINEDSDSDSD